MSISGNGVQGAGGLPKPASVVNLSTNLGQITIKAPATLTRQYPLVLPGALPASTLPVQVDTSGNVTFAQVPTAGIVDGAVTPAKKASLTTAQSSSSGSYTMTSASMTAVSNLSVSPTCLGHPVLVQLVPSGSGGYVSFAGASSFNYTFKRNGSAIGFGIVQAGAGNTISPGAFACYDLSCPAGANTYTFNVQSDGATTLSVIECILTFVEF